MYNFKIPFGLLVTLVTCSLLQPSVFAQSTNRHAAIEKYLDSQTLGLGWVAVDKVDVDKLADFADQLTGSATPPAIRGSAEVQKEERGRMKVMQQALLQNGVTNIYCIVEYATIAQGAEIVVIPTTHAAEVIKLMEEFVGGNDAAARFVADGNIVVGGKQALVDAILEKDGAVAPALRTALYTHQAPHGLVMLAPAPLTRALVNSPTIKSWVGDDLRLASLVVQSLASLKTVSLETALPPEHAKLRIESQSGEAAEKVADLANQFLQSRISEVASQLSFSAKGTYTTIESTSLDQSVAALGSLQKIFGQPMTAVHMTNMKQIALALHNYMDVHGSMPPQALTDKNGKRLLSWRVLILPYVEQQALYEQFRLDEPWDSEHNLKLAKSIPKVYNDIGTPVTPPRTRVVAPLTSDSPFGKAGRPIFFTDVHDGTSNTIWLVQADPSRSVVWTKPEDATLDPQNPLEALLDAERPSDHIIVGRMDGSVQVMPTELLKKWLIPMLTIQGGEVINFEESK